MTHKISQLFQQNSFFISEFGSTILDIPIFVVFQVPLVSKDCKSFSVLVQPHHLDMSISMEPKSVTFIGT